MGKARFFAALRMTNFLNPQFINLESALVGVKIPLGLTSRTLPFIPQQ